MKKAVGGIVVLGVVGTLGAWYHSAQVFETVVLSMTEEGKTLGPATIKFDDVQISKYLFQAKMTGASVKVAPESVLMLTVENKGTFDLAYSPLRNTTTIKLPKDTFHIHGPTPDMHWEVRSSAESGQATRTLRHGRRSGWQDIKSLEDLMTQGFITGAAMTADHMTLYDMNKNKEMLSMGAMDIALNFDPFTKEEAEFYDITGHLKLADFKVGDLTYLGERAAGLQSMTLLSPYMIDYTYRLQFPPAKIAQLLNSKDVGTAIAMLPSFLIETKGTATDQAVKSEGSFNLAYTQPSTKLSVDGGANITAINPTLSQKVSAASQESIVSAYKESLPEDVKISDADFNLLLPKDLFAIKNNGKWNVKGAAVLAPLNVVLDHLGFELGDYMFNMTATVSEQENKAVVTIDLGNFTQMMTALDAYVDSLNGLSDPKMKDALQSSYPLAKTMLTKLFTEDKDASKDGKAVHRCRIEGPLDNPMEITINGAPGMSYMALLGDAPGAAKADAEPETAPMDAE